jgi:hypothetical protein
VIRPAVAKHDRLDQRGPAEIVDVVERRLGADQHADHLGMAEMGGGDQSGAVIGTGGQAGAGAARQQSFQHRAVVLDRRNGDRVIALGIERARIGAVLEQGAHRGAAPREGRDMQGRAAMGIRRVEVFAGFGQAADLCGVTGGRRRVEAAIGGQLGRSRRSLGERFWCATQSQRGGQCEEQAHGVPFQNLAGAGVAG